MLKDMLLHIDTYPDPSPPEAVSQAVAFTKLLNGRLTALACELTTNVHPGGLAEVLLDIAGPAVEEEAKSRAAAKALLAQFREEAVAAGVHAGEASPKAEFGRLGVAVAERARTRDLCLVPMAGRLDGQQAVIEDTVFRAGRPVIAWEPGVANLPTEKIGLVVVAWDNSVQATRALASAMPILMAAREVQILTAVNEKPTAWAGAGNDVVRHLAAHGVAAKTVEVDATHHKVGDVLLGYAEKHHADLFVMGAYGRSNVRDFIMGGATEFILRRTKVPLLLAH